MSLRSKNGAQMKVLRRNTTIDLQQMEKALAETLVPISPRGDFLDRLQAQLKASRNAPEIVIQGQQPDDQKEKITLISLAGIFSVLMLVAAGFRAVIAILGAIGLVSELRNLKSKKAQPVPSTL